MKLNATTTVTLTLSQLYLIRAALEEYLSNQTDVYQKIDQEIIALEDSLEFNKEEKRGKKE